MVTKEEIKEALRAIVMYNGLDKDIKEWRDKLRGHKEKEYLSLADIQDEEIIVARTNAAQRYEYVIHFSQLQVFWMLLVLLFGNYGTSPRSGWIDDTESAAAFLDDLLKNSITYLD